MRKKHTFYIKITFILLIILALGLLSKNKLAFSASPSDGGVYNAYNEPDDDFDPGFDFDDDCDCYDDDNDDEPDATTRSASSVGDTNATLNARVDGNGSSTRVWFEYGRNRDLDDETSQRSIGSGTDTVSTRISGLRRDTTYYFRVVARNNDGTDSGSIMSFRTDEDDNNNEEDEVVLNKNTVVYTPPPVYQYVYTPNTTKPATATPTEVKTPEIPVEEKEEEKEEASADGIGSSLTANVLGFGFFPTTLLGWLAFVVLILALYILGRKHLYPPTHQAVPVEIHSHH